ncbi:uncharacterized protein LOC126899437 [Daktulosphaira vitifoliae]|uniref:uncharacterized protein LOC126899437 n=1 Tax=Daktulosphaira vitifoliae TaxID=58002 RepID=UPI0021AA6EEF|nr:uncharacterized protein LOC126899437 [Daktulosphaira vitifoliae]
MPSLEKPWKAANSSNLRGSADTSSGNIYLWTITNGWVIVFFAPENKYSIVPVKWIIYCGKICFCKWPKKGNINNMIKDFIEPENDWPTYPITVVSQYFDDYPEASMKEKEIFTSSDTTPNKKKRTKQSIEISDCPNGKFTT